MPSAVDVCNLALSHIGDVADVQSINPPDASVQAGFCSRFYPIALQSLLEASMWDFSARRATLALLAANPSTTWMYAYAVPAEMLNTIAVLPPDALDDYTENVGRDPRVGWDYPLSYYAAPADNFYTPQPFALETIGDGTVVLLTNVENAVLRYTTLVNDPNKFSALFVMALSYQLASMLAGPIIKGDTGASVGTAMLSKAMSYVSMAKTSDANQRRLDLKQSVPWMAKR